jgi:hypothetical protein
MKSGRVVAFLLVCSLVAGQAPVSAAPVPPGSKLYFPIILRSEAPTSPWVTILADDFETDGGAWEFVDHNGAVGGDFRPARRDCRPKSGDYSAWLVGGGADGALLPCGANYPNDANSRMLFGPFSLAGATAAKMRFDAWVNKAGLDLFCYAASSDNVDWNSGAVCIDFPSTGWTLLELDLADAGYSGVSFLGEPEVWVAFIFLSDGSSNAPEGAYVDNVRLSKCSQPSCPPLTVAR